MHRRYCVTIVAVVVGLVLLRLIVKKSNLSRSVCQHVSENTSDIIKFRSNQDNIGNIDKHVRFKNQMIAYMDDIDNGFRMYSVKPVKTSDCWFNLNDHRYQQRFRKPSQHVQIDWSWLRPGFII